LLSWMCRSTKDRFFRSEWLVFWLWLKKEGLPIIIKGRPSFVKVRGRQRVDAR